MISVENESVKKDILKNIAEDIILKDIVPKHNIINSSQIKDLFHYVVSNATTTLNYTTLSRKIEIDAKTIKEYIKYFEDNFLVSTISSYHTKITQQIKSAKKLYISDNGFLNLGVRRSLDNGANLENIVFLALKQPCKEVAYIKENYEIDFKCEDELIQVSYKMDSEKTKKRELRVFANFDKEKRYKHKIITYDKSGSFENIQMIKIEDFLLDLLEV